MDQLSFKVGSFEGPLDLLISLIGKKKIEVWDIHVSEILEQYMAYLARMREMDMEISSAFLAMASNLIYIKSRMLLPHLQENQEEDPRAELARSLREYQIAKEGAEALRERYEQTGTAFPREQDMQPAAEARPEDGEFRVSDLVDAFRGVMVRTRRRLPPPIQSFSGIVGREPVPVADRIRSILGSLRRYGIMKFGTLFRKSKSRSEIVATFLAVLELTKDKKIHISDVGESGEFLNSTVELTVPDEQAPV